MKIGKTVNYSKEHHKPKDLDEAIDVVEKTIEWLESLEGHFGNLSEKDGMLIAPNNFAEWNSLWGLRMYLKELKEIQELWRPGI